MGMRRAQQQDGWLLVGLIVLLSGVFIAMAGIALALGQSRQVISVRVNDTKAANLAQAGIMQALYDFRNGTGVALGEGPPVDPGPAAGTSDDNVFILGGQMADVFLANLKSTAFQGASICSLTQRDRMQDWRVRNVLASGGTSAVLNTIQVSWSLDLGEKILRIDLDGTAADWRDSTCVGVPSGTVIDLTSLPVSQRTIAPTQVWSTNRIWFNSTNVMANKAWINITFTLSDGTVRTAHYEPLVRSRSADFTIKSVGEVRKGAFPFVTWRRIQTEYRLCNAAALASQCDSTSEELTAAGALSGYRELVSKSP